MSESLDDFLRRAAQKRQQQQRNSTPPPAAPPTSAPPTPAEPRRVAPPPTREQPRTNQPRTNQQRGDSSRGGSQQRRSNQPSQRVSSEGQGSRRVSATPQPHALGSSAAAAQSQMESHLEELTNHQVGTIGSVQEVGSIAAVGMPGSENAETENLVAKLIQQIQEPGGIGRALLLNEILRRPTERW
jgi:hypothetical protein